MSKDEQGLWARLRDARRRRKQRRKAAAMSDESFARIAQPLGDKPCSVLSSQNIR